MASFLIPPHVKTHFPSPQFLIPNSNMNSATHNLQMPCRYGNIVVSKRSILSSKSCAKGSSVGKIERRLEEQLGTEEDLARSIGRLTGKCEQVDGIVDLLECLEREAIMGEDEGKEPMDYNRRAQIFDKSSTIFQALKEKSETTTTTNS